MPQALHNLPKFIVWAMAIYILFTAAHDFHVGGNPWKQGDWLINNEGTLIRRGLVGSIILSLSDTLSVNPVLFVVVLQSVLIFVAVLLLSLSIRRLNHRHILWLLVLSPGFFISLWTTDPQGGLRKELIVFLAFAVLLYGSTHPISGRISVYLSAIILMFGLLAHEGNILFIPFFVYCYVLLFSHERLQRGDMVVIAVSLMITTACTLILAIFFGTVGDHMVVCLPLLDAGLAPEMCSGAIEALEIGLSEFAEASFWMFFSARMLSFVLMYMMVAGPILFIGSRLFGFRPFVVYYLGSALIFLPLYAVAVDWGRWLSFHTTAVIFTMLVIFSLGGKIKNDGRDIASIPFALLLVFSITWGTSHFVYVVWGGILWKGVTGTYGLIF